MRNIPQETFAIWVDVLKHKDVYYALERLGLLESAGEDREVVDCPTWLFLLIPGLLKSQDLVPYLASLFGSPAYFRLPKHNRGLFVARSIQHFLKIRHYVAVREAVEWVCRYDLDLVDARSFARCFEALGSHPSRSGSMLSAPPFELLHPLVGMLRATMVERNIKPTLESFLPLFLPALLPRKADEAARLFVEMAKAGFQPKSKVLHQVMEAYAEDGMVERSQMIYRAMLGLPAPTPSARDEQEGDDDDGLDVIHDSEWADEEDDVSATAARYVNTKLSALARDSSVAMRYFDALLEHTRTNQSKTNTFPPLVDGVTWSNLFRILSRAVHTVTSADLFAILRRLESSSRGSTSSSASYVPPAPTNKIYHSVMDGFFRRSDYRLVLSAWHAFISRRLHPDAHIIDVVARAYRALLRPAEALQLLEFHAHRPSIDPPLPRRPNRQRHVAPPGTPYPVPHSVVFDTIPLNNLLVDYSNQGQTTTVWEQFQRFETDFGVLPDHATLTIVISAARAASAAAGRGYGPGFERIEAPGIVAGQVQSDLWNGRPACEVAERLCWDLLETNWPEIARRVKNPLDVGGGRRGLFDRILAASSDHSHGGSGGADEGVPLGPFPATLRMDRPPLYPFIFPNERVFIALIRLIGFHSSAREIPLVLAWMKELEIQPSKDTIGLAMMYVGELGLRVKEMDKWKEWLVDWCGAELVWSDEDIAWLRRGGVEGPRG